MATEDRAGLTKEPIPIFSRASGHRLLKVLKAIMSGIDVEIGGYPVRLCETSKGGIVPAFLIDEDECLVRRVPDMSIAWLSDHIADMSDEEFERISQELAIVEISFELAVSRALSIAGNLD